MENNSLCINHMLCLISKSEHFNIFEDINMPQNVVQETKSIIHNTLLFIIVNTGVNTSAENRQIDQGTLTNMIVDSLNRNLVTVGS